MASRHLHGSSFCHIICTLASLFVLALPAISRGQTEAAVAIEKCDNAKHILPAGSINTDLQISGVACTADGSAGAGTYIYRNVNIWGGGSLTFADAKINFHAHSILIENKGTLQAGFDKPIHGPLSIWLYGSATDSVPSVICQSGSKCGVPEKIWGSNPSMAMRRMPPKDTACTPAGSDPVGKDCFYQYDKFQTGDREGAYFGRKVMALSYGGVLYLRGEKGIREGKIDATPSDSGTSWVHLNESITEGALSFHVDRPVPTWGKGDHIVLTSTDYLPGHSEESD